MGRFLRKSGTLTLGGEQKIKRKNDEFYLKAIQQAMMSGGSIVVFLPREKRLLIE